MAQQDSETKQSLEGAQSSPKIWDFAKRNHAPALLAVGAIVWLVVSPSVDATMVSR